MRLLHVTPFYEPAWGYGGVARAAAALCRALARHGHEVTVATARLADDHPAEELRDGVRVRRFPSWFASSLVPWTPGLGRFLDRELPACDLVHLHGHRSGMAATLARRLRRSGTPLVVQPHGTFPHHGQRRLAKAAFDRSWGEAIIASASAVVALSRAEAAELPRPAEVVPNGVEGRALPRPTRDGGERLLFVGNDRLQKRGVVLPQLLAALPEARLELVGRYGSRFLERFESSAGRVRVSGVVDPQGLAQAFARADVVVHPAVGEAFGLVPFEASLAGVPAVVAGGHGCGEWFSKAGGCVVPPDDGRAMAAAVRERLDVPERGLAEAGAVAAFTSRELTWDRAAGAVTALYGRLLRRPAA